MEFLFEKLISSYVPDFLLSSFLMTPRRLPIVNMALAPVASKYISSWGSTHFKGKYISVTALGNVFI